MLAPIFVLVDVSNEIDIMSAFKLIAVISIGYGLKLQVGLRV